MPTHPRSPFRVTAATDVITHNHAVKGLGKPSGGLASSLSFRGIGGTGTSSSGAPGKFIVGTNGSGGSNGVGEGGGVAIFGTATIDNTTISNNTASTGNPDVLGTFSQ